MVFLHGSRRPTDSVGWRWDRLEEVATFIRATGHFPRDSTAVHPTERSMGMWLKRQRGRFAAGRLDSRELEALDTALGRRWRKGPALHVPTPRRRPKGPQRRHRKSWTVEEDAVALDDNKPLAEAAAILGRTEGAVGARRRLLKMAQKPVHTLGQTAARDAAHQVPRD